MENSNIKRGTFIYGIAASEALDSSGERIKIEGVDISSLTHNGVLNMEHQSKEASSIVGKIWEAKKILKQEDCENEHHKYFWDKIKMPFIFIIGELFDAVGHKQAQEIAAMLRFDKQDSLNKDSRKLINFSIEGSRVEKQGSLITKCIARKVSITLTPCNHTCVAEEFNYDPNAKKEVDSGAFKYIQDAMSKSDESSCQILKDEYLYKNSEIKIPAKEAIKEHKRLVDVLESPSHKDDKKEAKKQKKELKEYKEKEVSKSKPVNPKDPVLNPGKYSPKAMTDKQKKEYSERVDKLKEKGIIKKKLDKFESNVRKALTASIGTGAAPSTKINDVTKSEYIYINDMIKNELGNKMGTTQSGKDIYSHARVGSYQNFSPQDHMDAINFHKQAIAGTQNLKLKEHHNNKILLHQAAFSTAKEKQIKQEKAQPVPTQQKTGTLGYSQMATSYGNQLPKIGKSEETEERYVNILKSLIKGGK